MLKYRPWTPLEDQILLRHISSASTPWRGCLAASRVINRTAKACYDRYARKLAGKPKPAETKPAEAAKSKSRLMLHRRVRSKGRLTAGEIEEIAQATGRHYHSVLSALGGLHAHDVFSDPCPGCGEVKSLRSRIAELEPALQARETQLERLRTRVAELESTLGSGIDPLSIKLGEPDNIIAGLGACAITTSCRQQVLAVPKAFDVLGLLTWVCSKVEDIAPKVLLNPGKYSAGARKYYAVLGACLSWLEQAGSRTKPDKPASAN